MDQKESKTPEELLIECVNEIEGDKKALAIDTLNEYLFFKKEIDKLSGLPLIRIDKKNPARQVITPAGKLIKDYSQVLDAKRGLLLRIMNKGEGNPADDLLKKLAEFE